MIIKYSKRLQTKQIYQNNTHPFGGGQPKKGKKNEKAMDNTTCVCTYDCISRNIKSFIKLLFRKDKAMFERDRIEELRDFLVRSIIEWQNQDHYTKEELQKKSTKDLIAIFENVK